MSPHVPSVSHQCPLNVLSLSPRATSVPVPALSLRPSGSPIPPVLPSLSLCPFNIPQCHLSVSSASPELSLCPLYVPYPVPLSPELSLSVL
ncbi:hypothetical protein DV515_00020001, partial [Chloebia gouldiae]